MFEILNSGDGVRFVDALRKRLAWSVNDIREVKRFIKQIR